MSSIPFIPADASPFLVLWVVFLVFFTIVLVMHVLMLLVRLVLRARVKWLLREHYRPR